MSSSELITDRSSPRMALAFSASLTMWSIAYFGRLPGVGLPPAVLVVSFAAVFVGFGIVTRIKLENADWRDAAWVGAGAALINFLVLGSLVIDPESQALRPAVWIWLPGSLLAGAIASSLGFRLSKARPRPTDWPAAMAAVLMATIFLQLLAGGIVTSSDAGLAVVDWPNSFGSNMILYPLSRMSGGIFYEHAHRLLGMLVGVATIATMIDVLRSDRRLLVRFATVVGFIAVCIQGLLGGLRVTGRLTNSMDPEHMRPSLLLALIHGVGGQLIFAAAVALWILRSKQWIECRRTGAGRLRGGAVILILLISVQLGLGAQLRHFGEGLMIHIAVAMIVLFSCWGYGFKSWARVENGPLARAGIALIGVSAFQVTLGFVAMYSLNGRYGQIHTGVFEVLATTVHQACGALVLAAAAAVAVWGLVDSDQFSESTSD